MTADELKNVEKKARAAFEACKKEGGFGVFAEDQIGVDFLTAANPGSVLEMAQQLQAYDELLEELANDGNNKAHKVLVEWKYEKKVQH